MKVLIDSRDSKDIPKPTMVFEPFEDEQFRLHENLADLSQWDSRKPIVSQMDSYGNSALMVVPRKGPRIPLRKLVTDSSPHGNPDYSDPVKNSTEKFYIRSFCRIPTRPIRQVPDGIFIFERLPERKAPGEECLPQALR